MTAAKRAENRLISGLRTACVAFSLLLLGGAPALADTATPAANEDTVQVDGQTLRLNGSGIHVINRVKIFTIGYYLPKLKTTQAELLASPGPIRLKLVMLKSVEGDLMASRFLADIRTSTTKEERNQLLVQLMGMGQAFSEVGDWKVGHVMTIDWVHNKGVTFHENGKQIGETLKDDLTMQAILRIWVGDNSNDPKLKRQLLGSKE